MIAREKRPNIRGQREPLRAFVRHTGGAAAAEFVLWLGVMTFPVWNVVELGVYAMRRMQVEIAAQAAVQAVWNICDASNKLPATTSATKCGPDLLTTITTAAQSTSLGNAVSIAAGSPVEGYYCANSSATLVLASSGLGTIGAPPTAPADCSTAVPGNKTKPGDYIQVTTTYTYTPTFQVSVTSLLPSQITRTAWMRLG